MSNKWTLPIKTKWMGESMVHEPSRSYAQELHEVVREHCPESKSTLEIGAAWGISTLAILLAAPMATLTSVDANPCPHADEEIKANDLSSRWSFVRCRSDAFWPTEQRMFDLVYVDGSHHYRDALLDLSEGWKRLVPGGVLVADDFTHPNNEAGSPQRDYGVAFAAWQLVKANDIRAMRAYTRLLVFKKPI